MKVKNPIISERIRFVELINSIVVFTEEEKTVAMELFDEYLKGNHDYIVYVCEKDQKFTSFICFGPTPMTLGTYDLYWIGTNPKFTKQGQANHLIEVMKEHMRAKGAYLIRIETSSQDSYDGTVKFYHRIGCQEEARIKDFYKPHDDLIIYTLRV